MKPGKPGLGSIDEEKGDTRSGDSRKRKKVQATAADPQLLDSSSGQHPALFPLNPSPYTNSLTAILDPRLELHHQSFSIPRRNNSGGRMMMLGPPPQLATSSDDFKRSGSFPPPQQLHDQLQLQLQQQQLQLASLHSQSSLTTMPVSSNNNTTRGGAAASLGAHHLFLGEQNTPTTTTTSTSMEVHANFGIGSLSDPTAQQSQLLGFQHQAQQFLQQAAATTTATQLPSLSTMDRHHHPPQPQQGWNYQPGFLPHQPLVAGSNGFYEENAITTINPDAFASSLRGEDGDRRTALRFGATAAAGTSAGIGANTNVDLLLLEPVAFPTDNINEDNIQQLQQVHQQVLVPQQQQQHIGRAVAVPVTLFMRCDMESLSEYQCLVRRQIELFEAGPEDLESNTKGRNKPIVPGQVGIRCRHCSKLRPSDRPKGATYFPAKLNGVYQAAQGLAFGHLRTHCQHIPADIREQLEQLREKKSSAGGGKQYWSEGVRIHGVYEDAYGLRYYKNASNK